MSKIKPWPDEICGAHIQCTPGFLLRALYIHQAKGTQQDIVSENNTPIPIEDAIKYLHGFVDKGYEVMPCPCGDNGPPGKCPGWTRKK